MQPFRAYRIHCEDGTVRGRIETIGLEDLSPGDVLIRTAYSSVNYKDALAATGAGKILKRFPLAGGIDAAGTVVRSESPDFEPGDSAIVSGCGLSEDHDGGYAEYLRVPAEWVVRLPAGLTLRESMAIGTAGFTAALALLAMERNGQSPSAGPILVTGATGGVGSLAIDLFSSRGYEVTALTGKPQAADYLRGIGAKEILARDSVELSDRPLESARWGGAVDNVGGEILSWVTRTTKARGNIASIGLAGGAELHTTVYPFILRGVSLLGINSSVVPVEERRKVWERLGGDLKPHHLERIISREITLEELPGIFDRMLRGEALGRVIVRID